ncbi:hypothetical protein F7725_027618 [Dissostichus mawsoni]|uniref:Myocilin n=1 Tax=Dissostichus mawsoni TaxID=36200 RepID=A0A7J5XDI1_DISMA|nr:hypothetical protein F7725_027618 [Dissostichus mawsoni]
MLVLLLLCTSGLLLRGDAQDRAALWRGNDRSGRCQYTFSVPSPTEASCPQTGGPEVEGLKARLSLLEVLVSRLTGGDTGGPQGATARDQTELHQSLNRVTGERNLLQGEKERLEQELEGLQRRMEEMRRETERLRNKPCPLQTPAVPPSPPLQDSGLTRPAGGSRPSHLIARPNRQGDSSSLRDSVWQIGPQGFQELKAEVTEVPAPDGSEENTGCGDVVSVGEPVTHRKADTIAGKYGVWMQDPEAVSPYGPNMIWRIDTIGSDVRQLYGYEDMEQLTKGFPSKVETSQSFPDPLRPGLREHRSPPGTPPRRLPRTVPLLLGRVHDIDLSVDEQGLWAVYSSSKAKGAIVISQLDPNSLEVKRSWETNIRKNSVANSFIICGKLYTVASYTSPDTIINYIYDTRTSQGKSVAIPFKNKYRYNSMIDYNLAQRKLFAWDNFHMVSYDLRLGRQE